MDERLERALLAIEEETRMARVKGMDSFEKGQLPRGIGWSSIEKLQEMGLVEVSGLGADREIRISSKGQAWADDIAGKM